MTLALRNHSSTPQPGASRAGVPLCTVLLGVFAVVASFLPVTDWLQYDRAAIVAGQWWRVLSGHFTHWSFDHLAWDVAAFVVLAALNERRDRRQFLACTILTAVAVSAGVWLARPDMTFYRGLSGIDSGLFVLLTAGFLRDARRQGDRLVTFATVAALAGFGAKTLWEIAAGSTVFVRDAAGFEPLPLAHVIGGTIGLLIALRPAPFVRRFSSQPQECVP